MIGESEQKIIQLFDMISNIDEHNSMPPQLSNAAISLVPINLEETHPILTQFMKVLTEKYGMTTITYADFAREMLDFSITTKNHDLGCRITKSLLFKNLDFLLNYKKSCKDNAEHQKTDFLFNCFTTLFSDIPHLERDLKNGVESESDLAIDGISSLLFQLKNRDQFDILELFINANKNTNFRYLQFNNQVIRIFVDSEQQWERLNRIFLSCNANEKSTFSIDYVLYLDKKIAVLLNFYKQHSLETLNPTAHQNITNFIDKATQFRSNRTMCQFRGYVFNESSLNDIRAGKIDYTKIEENYIQLNQIIIELQHELQHEIDSFIKQHPSNTPASKDLKKQLLDIQKVPLDPSNPAQVIQQQTAAFTILAELKEDYMTSLQSRFDALQKRKNTTADSSLLQSVQMMINELTDLIREEESKPTILQQIQTEGSNLSLPKIDAIRTEQQNRIDRYRSEYLAPLTMKKDKLQKTPLIEIQQQKLVIHLRMINDFSKIFDKPELEVVKAKHTLLYNKYEQYIRQLDDNITDPELIIVNLRKLEVEINDFNKGVIFQAARNVKNRLFENSPSERKLFKEINSFIDGLYSRLNTLEQQQQSIIAIQEFKTKLGQTQIAEESPTATGKGLHGFFKRLQGNSGHSSKAKTESSEKPTEKTPLLSSTQHHETTL